MTGTATIDTALAGRLEIARDGTRLKVNRIRYPFPNRLGLA